MTRQLQTWNFILNNLQQDIPVVLLYVVESLRSSPGRQGFCMAVNAKGIMKGSVGGGIMEHKFVELAKEKFMHPQLGEPGSIKRQVHDKSATQDRSGMICSGEQSIFIYTVQHSDLGHVQKLVDSLRKEAKGKLVLSPAGIRFEEQPPQQHYYFRKESEDWAYEELTGFRENIHIIGGGHCGLALSRLMRMLDFHVHIYDERSRLNTMLQNDAAHKKTTLENYAGLADIVESTPEDYIVLMTFGYRTDDIALRAIIDMPYRYLGLLGSKNKIEKMFSEYRQEGWSEAKLAKIHAPIGLDIGSETPEEIAVSIAAEIIKEKNHAHKDR